MKSKLIAGIVSSTLIVGCTSISNAVPIEFDYSGVDVDGLTASGSFTIDDSLFNGTASQSISNSNILSLSFTANAQFGSSSFGTSNIASSGALIFDSSGPTPVLVKGAPFTILALNGLFTITVLTGGQVEMIWIDHFDDYNGSWTDAGPVSGTPIPNIGAGLPGLVLAGGSVLGWLRRRRKAA